VDLRTERQPKPDGLFAEKPSGRRVFLFRGRVGCVPSARCGDARHSPALATAKSPRRSALRSLQTGSTRAWLDPLRRGRKPAPEILDPYANSPHRRHAAAADCITWKFHQPAVAMKVTTRLLAAFSDASLTRWNGRPEVVFFRGSHQQ